MNDFRSIETDKLLEMLSQHTQLYTSLFRSALNLENLTNIGNVIKGMLEDLDSRKSIISIVPGSGKLSTVESI